jgi:hypothetical protein
MAEYTPTTDEVADAWASRYDGEHTGATGSEYRDYEAEFDRWLATHDAEVEDRAYWRGYTQGLRDTLDRPDLARHWLDTSPDATPTGGAS